ncbi:MAG: hypothetical protein H0X51_10235 [Parachlamydiaceae bacterium]|nr:hypothetical protein [Parachlamydiaceae bacterium]
MSLQAIAETSRLHSLGWVRYEQRRETRVYVCTGLGYASIVKKIVTFSPTLAALCPWIAVASGVVRVLLAAYAKAKMTKGNSEGHFCAESHIVRGIAEICQLGLILLIADVAMTQLRMKLERKQSIST